MENDQQNLNKNKKRKIDVIAAQTYNWIGRTFVFMKKTKIKTWKAVFVVAFVAGNFAAIISVVSLKIQTTSDAIAGADLFLQDSASGENTLTLSNGDLFNLDIILNTHSNDIVVARAIVNYDPLVFQLSGWDLTDSVFDAGLNCSDVENPDRVCEIIEHNSETGTLDITLAKPSPGVNVTTGLVAALNFSVIGDVASESISLSYEGSGNYTDSDVIADDGLGTDILSSASGVSIVVNPLDVTAPVLSETTPVLTPTSDRTPNYTFNSTEAGTISYGGSCSSADVLATLGNNTITFDSLDDGVYFDCVVTVTDASANVSQALAVSSFTIEGDVNVSVRGDVDQNGAINSVDAMLVLRKASGKDMSQTSWSDLANSGDANCDGSTTVTDAMLILRNSNGLDMSQTSWCL